MTTMEKVVKRYTESHEWVVVEGTTGTVGVTDHAQKELGDIVYVELPEVGAAVSAGDESVVLESTKAAADVYSPVSGKITAVNETLTDAPEGVNSSAEAKGWLYKIEISDSAELEKLLDEEGYQALCQGQS